MIVHDSWWSNGSARSTIIDYHEPFDQGLKQWIALNARADWLVKLRISCAIYLPATQEKWRRSLHPWQVKKSSKLIFFCGVYYPTVLVYTKTTIHFSVGG